MTKNPSNTQRLRKSNPYLFLPGIFGILELSEAIRQGRMDVLDGLGLFRPVPALAFTRELCQPEKKKKKDTTDLFSIFFSMQP